LLCSGGALTVRERSLRDGKLVAGARTNEMLVDRVILRHSPRRRVQPQNRPDAAPMSWVSHNRAHSIKYLRLIGQCYLPDVVGMNSRLLNRDDEMQLNQVFSR